MSCDAIALAYCQDAFGTISDILYVEILASYGLFHQKAQDGGALTLCVCVGVYHDTRVEVDGLQEGRAFC